MKNYKSIKRYSTIVLTFILLTLGACEDSLEIDVRDSFASDLVLSTPEQVELLMLTTYNSTESFGAGSQFWARYMNVEIASFEARMNFNATTQALDQFAVLRGWTSANVGQLGQKWQDLWTYVRQANVFLELVEGSEAQINNPDEIEALKAEMRFLRANQYSKLLKFFGGVPLLTSAATLDDDFNIPRNSYQEVVEFIVSEIDEIAPLLPLTRDSGEFGRATRLAALALKSRTLLYAASDLHDPSLAPQSSNLELYTYNKAGKWQDAADAAAAVIDLVEDRDLISTPNAKAYQELFLSENQDILFARPFGGSVFGFGTDVTTQPDNAQSPRGFDGWGLSTPLHNYTLIYNMNDGNTTDSPSYDTANPYENREMRFYANINYQGAIFRGRPIDYSISVDNTVVPDGLDSFSQDQQTLGNFRHGSTTGYAMRKFQNEALGTDVKQASPGRPYIIYRLAEIYLNYAEASFRAGDEETARRYVSRVSERALQPAITASGPELLEAIKRERRVELAFEGHNFFDERRWLNEDNLGFDVQGLRWAKDLDENVSFEEFTIETRPFDQKQYYLPIPQSETNRTEALIQNVGY